MRSYEIGRHDGRTEWSSSHQDSLTYALRKQGLNMDGDEKVSNTQRMNRSMCLVLNQNNAAMPQMKLPRRLPLNRWDSEVGSNIVGHHSEASIDHRRTCISIEHTARELNYVYNATGEFSVCLSVCLSVY